jgi:hypothetical protein
MHRVGSRLGHGADGCARADRAARFLRAGGELELLQGVGERQVHARAVEVVQVGRAVERVRHAVLVAARDRDAHSGVHREGGRGCRLHGETGQGDELRHLARVQRQLDNPFALDDRSDAGGPRVDERRFARDLHFFGDRADTHGRIHDRIAVHLQHDAALREGGESLELRLEPVRPERQIRQHVRTRLVGDGRTHQAGLLLRDSNRHARQDGAALITGGAADGGGRLRKGRSTGEDDGEGGEA